MDPHFPLHVAGNAEAVKSSPAAQVDKLAPATTDDVPSSWQKNDVTVTLSASDTGGSGVDKTYYTVGTSPADPTTGSSVYNPAAKPVLQDGEKIKYFSVDVVGNAESVKSSPAARVDKQAPSTTDNVPSGWQAGPVTVTLSASDTGGSGVDKTYYTEGAGSADPTTSSSVYNAANKPVLGDGERIKYFSVDAAGNAEAVKTSPVVQIDAQAPATSDDVPTTWQKNDVTVTLSTSDTGGSGVDRTYYEAGASPVNPTTASSVYDPGDKPVLGDGESIRYFSVDEVGNAEAVKASPAAKVDKLGPQTTDDVPAARQTQPVTVTLTATDTGGSGVGATYYEIGASPPDPTTASSVYDPAAKPVLGDGQRIKYFTVDVAGNAEAVRTSAAASVDGSPPNTSINSGRTGTITTRTATFTFSSDENGSTFECRMDAAQFTSCTSPVTYEDLADGPHTFQVRSIDELGNVDPSPASQSFRVEVTQEPPADTTPPETLFNKKKKKLKKTAGKKVKVSFRASEPSTFLCRIDKKAWKPCTSPKKVKVKAGKHVFLVAATDEAGNADPTPAKLKLKGIPKG